VNNQWFSKVAVWLVIALVLFTVFSVACALSQTAEQLIIFRALQGTGAALMNPLSLSILTVLAICFASMLHFGLGWNTLDNPSRMILALLAFLLVVHRGADSQLLWTGALIGLIAAAAIIAWQVAVLKIELDRLPTIAFGDADNLQVGDIVLAIGNPFGVGQTVTSGIVSALGRNQLGEPVGCCLRLNKLESADVELRPDHRCGIENRLGLGRESVDALRVALVQRVERRVQHARRLVVARGLRCLQ
jgi:MFS family permease